MIRNNKGKLILSSIVILLPVIAGVLLWNKLPEQIAVHWGASGEGNRWSGKAFSVFAIPFFILVLHWICVLITAKDPKNQNQSQKAFGMVLWICPCISLLSNGIMYAIALGAELNAAMVTFISVGLMFVIVGNYLPKCRWNHTIGIKLTWTLNDEENWNKTHRLAGKVWVIDGLLLIALCFLPKYLFPVLFLVVLITALGVPMLYSWLYYKKQGKEGTLTAPDKTTALITKATWGFVAVIVVITGVLCVTGDIKMKYEAASFTIQATYWGDLMADYADIESIEYREQDIRGDRTSGFGSFRLQIGTFQNDEFGTYTRYTYTGCDSCVVLNVDGKILVINGIDDESTKAIFDTLTQKINQ